MSHAEVVITCQAESLFSFEQFAFVERLNGGRAMEHQAAISQLDAYQQ